MRRRASVAFASLLLLAAVGGSGPSWALAAGPPQVVSAAVQSVTATSAVLRGQVNPNGLATSYRFEYLTEAAYQANLMREPSGDGFQGASFAPPSGTGFAGSANSPTPISAQGISRLSPVTTYRYRLVATNSAGADSGQTGAFTTQAATNVFSLLDGRAWELVSPVDKGGGSIGRPGTLFGGGDFQVATGGDSITYGSAFSFAGGSGSPPASQYLSGRSSSGWGTTNISTPLLSASYGDEPDGVPYRLFSSDLSRALISNGERCRGESGGNCPVANPPLPGSEAPAGYRDYYLRSGGTFETLLTSAELARTARSAAEFELKLATTTPDLGHAVVSSCAALTTNATEVAGGDCATAPQNLYEWSGSGLTAINLLPGETATSPGAAIAARSGAISTDGSRVYWSESGVVYLRDGNTSRLVAPAGSFQAASSDGAVAFLTEGEHLLRYSATAGTATDLTPAGGVEGVLGASADGSRVYYETAAGLFGWSAGTTIEVAGAGAASDYPPSTGTARLSADGSHLLFLSAAELTGYPNAGETEVYLYGPPIGGGPSRLLCISCKSTGEDAGGSASIPGAIPNGSTVAYKPRVLSDNGQRVFFDSEDSLSIQDTNNHPDVYEWESVGEGSCTLEPGCVQLISSGRSPEPSSFIDASSDGSSAFFLTGESLVPTDPGAVDIYVAREGGGFPVAESVIPCDGDACQSLPGSPEDPTPGTQVANSGNPPLHFPKSHKHKHHKHKHHKKRHGHGKRKHPSGRRHGSAGKGGSR